MAEDFELAPQPASRRLVVDIGRAAGRRHTVAGLLQLDVTEARRLLRDGSEPRPSLTAYVTACVARAAAEHPDVHTYRDLRNRLWTPGHCDVNVSVEVELEGRPFPMNHVLRRAEERTPADLTAELRAVKEDPSASPTMAVAAGARRFLGLPSWLRHRLLGLLIRFPRLQRRMAGTVGVTSVGMFGAGPAFGIAFQVHTLDVVVGGLDVQPRYVDGEVEPREMLHVTLLFDHDVVDGAPAARFAARLRALIESAELLLAAPDRA
jgi:pyruvate/2-oxoglutarate dehydrogenase complex dihydrolipoamide acyltransferase (E2) component